MDTAEVGTAKPDKSEDPRFEHARKVGAGDKGRELVEHAALGAELDADDEMGALDWLLGAPAKLTHRIPVDYETPKGMAKLWFVVTTTDGKKIDAAEQRNIDPNSTKINAAAVDLAVVVECCSALEDSRGKVMEIRGEEFLTVRRPDGSSFRHASPEIALEERFREQLGLIQGVAAEIRRIAGYDRQRVGGAQRRLVEASLG